MTTSGSDFARRLPGYNVRTTHADDYWQFLFFRNNPISRGSAATNLTVRFSSHKTSSFTYNQSDNLYYMSQFGSQFTDANNNAPVAFSNLLILDVPVWELEGHGSGAGRQDMNTVGNGRGYFVNGGQYIPIAWHRFDKTSPFIYTYENGDILELGFGKTYVAFAPSLSNVEFN